MASEWETKIARHADGIDLTTATKDELAEYVNTKIYENKKGNFTDCTLWSLF